MESTAPPELYKDLPVLVFDTRQQFREWLDKNHASSTAVWLKLAKKASPHPTISYEDAVLEALCYGWIDSLLNGYDEYYRLQKFSPRKRGSVWSQTNVDRVAALTKAGQMQPAGLAAIEIAKQNGNWDNAYQGSQNMTVPADFQAALDKNPVAKQFYETLNKTNTYAFCWRVQTAKKPETRKARIEKFVAMLERGEKLH
jgi:uncharacterized protein YdeI (YjbR/CyaY-like superfamily)